MLLEIVTQVESWGAETFASVQLVEMTRQYPRAAEFNRVVMLVLLNYTSGNAKGMAEYGAENGFDAWRRRCHHYLPLSADLQQILIQELYALAPPPRHGG